MTRLLRSGLKLPVSEKLCFARACYWLCVCAGRIRVSGLRGTASYVERRVLHQHSVSTVEIDQRIAVWHRAVGRAARVLPVGTCLERALTLQLLLGRENIGTLLKIGVRPGADALHAHAWLERDGEPLLETVDPELRQNVFSGPWSRRREGSGSS